MYHFTQFVEIREELSWVVLPRFSGECSHLRHCLELGDHFPSLLISLLRRSFSSLPQGPLLGLFVIWQLAAPEGMIQEGGQMMME